MSGQMIDRLARLAPRERVLLAVLIGLVVPLALWFGVLVPLSERVADRRAGLADARALNGWVAARAFEMNALASTTDSGPRPPIGLSQIEQSLIAARLRDQVTTLANGVDGGIELRFDAVGFTALMGWISAQTPVWGYDLAQFHAVQTEDPGIVSVDLQMVPQGR